MWFCDSCAPKPGVFVIFTLKRKHEIPQGRSGALELVLKHSTGSGGAQGCRTALVDIEVER